MLGDEHPSTLTTIKNMGALLREQGKHQQAIDLLAPAEPAVRTAFTGGNASRLAGYLTILGQARVGLGWGGDAGRFTLAEKNLIEAHGICLAAKDRGAAHQQTLACVQALVDLYSAWDEAAPDKGYDAKADEWRARLDAVAETAGSVETQ